MRTTATGLALLFLAGVLASAAPQDPLWLKAVQTQVRTRDWSPGSVTIHAQVFDDKGALTDTSETRLRTWLGLDGTVQTDVLKSVKNGRDETEKTRRALSGKKDGAGHRAFSMGTDDNPFSPAVQDAVEAKSRADTRVVAERVCALFDFTFKKDGRTYTGTAAIDQDSGSPVEVSYTVSPLPFGARSMQTVVRFGTGPEGDGYVREVLVSGAGSFLFVSRSLKSEITLDNYWKSGRG